MSDNEILYIRYYERIDNTREMITKKYYDLDEDDATAYAPEIGEILPVVVLLNDLESAARSK